MKDLLRTYKEGAPLDNSSLLNWHRYVDANIERWKEGLKGEYYDKNSLTDYVLSIFNLASASDLLPNNIHKIDVDGVPVLITDSYLQVVDQWNQLEPDLQGKLDRTKTINLFTSYIQELHGAKQRHGIIFKKNIKQS